MAGGAFVLARRVRVGSTLIFLGGGAGFLGLLVSLVLAVWGTGFSLIVGYAPYWVGLLLSAVARSLIKKTGRPRTGRTKQTTS